MKLSGHNRYYSATGIPALFFLLAVLACLTGCGRTCKVRFLSDTSPKAEVLSDQKIEKGSCAVVPEAPTREGCTFLYWVTESERTVSYDFALPIEKDTTLYALWYEEADTEDSDKDGLPDGFEAALGTDPEKADSDGDGIPDGFEYLHLHLNPLKQDSDGNGISDGEEDSDGDGLMNAEEVNLGTAPQFADSDFDGLSDGEERLKHHTDPLDKDSDGDGVDDCLEVALGSDPLRKETSFVSTWEAPSCSGNNPVSVTVTAVTDSIGAGTLTADILAETNAELISSYSVGYLGAAFRFETEGSLESATLTFTCDSSLGTPGEDFLPCVYYYNEEANLLEEVENQVFEDGKVTVEVSHFSVYSLMDKKALEAADPEVLYRVAPSEKDSNGDGLSDYFTGLINEGLLLYNNTYLLAGVTNIFGEDNADWDGDGLLNGEEITVTRSAPGLYRITVHSNPILADSDFDGIDDYTEVIDLGTEPLRYDRRSVGALDQLMNNARYLYSAKQDDWRSSFALTLDFGKQDEAKECLMDYFYEYASEEAIAKSAETIAAYSESCEALRQIALTGKLLCSFASMMKSAYQIEKMDDYYQEVEDSEGNIRAVYSKNYLDSLGTEKEAIEALNMENISAVFQELSLLSLPDTIENFLEALEEGDNTELLTASGEVVSSLSETLQLYQGAQQAYVLSVALQLKKQNELAASFSKAAAGYKGPSVLTVVATGVKATVNIIDTASTYGQMLANADAYLSYLELLQWIRDNAEDDYVRNAARDVACIVLDNGGTEYFNQLTIACAKEVAEAAFGLLFGEMAKINPYAAIAKGFLDLYGQTGITDLSKYSVYFKVMEAVSNGCRELLSGRITCFSQTFSYSDTDREFVELYLTQLAQSRIIGEYYWYTYISSESAASLLSSYLSNKTPDEYMAMFDPEAELIYGYANRLQLRLSPALPLYGKYWDPSVPEDELEISAFSSIYKAYLTMLKNDKTEIYDYNWKCGGRDSDPNCIALCDICGDEAPELIYIAAENSYNSRLIIYTYEGNRIRELYSDYWDGIAGGGFYYSLLYREGEKALYAYISTGDEGWNRYVVRFVECDGILEAETLLRYSTHPDYSSASPYSKYVEEYYLKEQEIGEEQFIDEWTAFASKVAGVLIRTPSGHSSEKIFRPGDDLPEAAMTYLEAVCWLKGQMGVFTAKTATLSISSKDGNEVATVCGLDWQLDPVWYHTYDGGPFAQISAFRQYGTTSVGYVFGNDGVVTCLDVKTGDTIWETEAARGFGILDRDGTLYLSGSASGNRLFAIDCKGKLLYEEVFDGYCFRGPVSVTSDGFLEYTDVSCAATQEYSLTVYVDKATGELFREKPVR